MWHGISEYLRPRSLDELFALLSQHGPRARVVAGGTDLLVGLRQAPRQAERVLVSLRSVAELRGIRLDDSGSLRIGSATPIAELIESPLVHERAAVLALAARALGSAQIRAVATLGGNLCNASPCADTAPPLLVLDASAELLGPGGARRVALHEFFRGPGATALQPGEILGAVIVPASPPGSAATFLKKRRVRMDLAQASVAALLALDGERVRTVRLAAGSVAPTPLRLLPVEELVRGQALERDLLVDAGRLAATSVSPLSDIRASEGYRRQIVGVYVRRALEELAARIREDR